MQKSLGKSLLISSLYLIIPLIISTIISLWFHIAITIPLIVIFIVMLFFMIPSDSMFPGLLDYNAKRINPSHKDEKPTFSVETKEQMFHFLIAVVGLIVSLVLTLWF